MKTKMFFYDKEWIQQYEGWMHRFTLEDIHAEWTSEVFFAIQEQWPTVSADPLNDFAREFDFSEVFEIEDMKEWINGKTGFNRVGDIDLIAERLIKENRQELLKMAHESISGIIDAEELQSDPYAYYGLSRSDF